MKNFKQILIIFVTIVIVTQLHSQNVDSIAYGVIRYLQKADLHQDKSKDGIALLWFNSTISQYVQTAAPSINKVVMENDGTIISIAGDPNGFPIFKDHKSKQIIYRTKCFQRDLGKYCLVNDTLGTINWKIFPTSKKSLGTYECIKAEGYFRGREYEVWFTPEIPIPSGPFKLGGLPGLILEAKSKDGLVEFLFDSMELSIENHTILRIPEGYSTNLDFKAYNKANIEYVTERVRSFSAENGGIPYKIGSPQGDFIEYW